ncbi:MAG: AsmA family protein [Candidatus Omnitrophica bacterium]|jgi:uncharacterized protein involved in outer membrane biogenesis|nr:AsmA family protein [Candidatus Omnitrophota bacterium]MDD3987724.1 AsmA family protein [Candidatus Omnitrophota bacterium]MDD4981836.1 AsmA family protein [Candidatus Omnitrophota bacterium]MDD5665558.1 AsmA family protein [Candidatus Omnitrophota bacterium]
MKKLFKILVIIFAVIIGLLFAKNIIAKVIVEQGVGFATGLKLRVSGFQVGIFKSRINIDNLKLYNPKGFEDKVMVDIPNIYVDYDLPSIFKGKVHLRDVRLNLKEFLVIKNREGAVNLNALKPVQAQKASKKTQEKPSAKAPDIQVDKLELKINKVIYKDYSKGEIATVREFNVNINEKYTNIKNLNALVSIIISKALVNTAIAGLTNIDLKGLNSIASDNLSAVTNLTTDTAAKAAKRVGDAGKSVTDAAAKLKDSLKLPFGEN